MVGTKKPIGKGVGRPAVRVDDDTMERLARLAKRLSDVVPGINVSFADAVRVAILRGLDLLEAEAVRAAESGPGKTP